VVKVNAPDQTYVRIVVKGAPDYLMPYCISQVDTSHNLTQTTFDHEEGESLLDTEILLPMAKERGLKVF
jgi:hypothetical protein